MPYKGIDNPKISSEKILDKLKWNLRPRRKPQLISSKVTSKGKGIKATKFHHRDAAVKILTDAKTFNFMKLQASIAQASKHSCVSVPQQKWILINANRQITRIDLNMANLDSKMIPICVPVSAQQRREFNRFLSGTNNDEPLTLKCTNIRKLKATGGQRTIQLEISPVIEQTPSLLAENEENLLRQENKVDQNMIIRKTAGCITKTVAYEYEYKTFILRLQDDKENFFF